MRVLILGAGATGGYFGGRLIESGADVTFLVRQRRYEQLNECGLIIKSSHGDCSIQPVSAILDAAIEKLNFDVVLMACKAFDLESALSAVAPAINSGTAVIPLLNGMRHLDSIGRTFGCNRLLGGYCAIAATLSPEGHIVHLNDNHTIRFGELTGESSQRVNAIDDMMKRARIDAAQSSTIVHDMWEKWIMLATLAGITCLMRASIGTILSAPFGKDAVMQLLDECLSISMAHGFEGREAFFMRTRGMLLDTQSRMTASMLRDIQSGGRTEADHVLGDLIQRAQEKQVQVPLLHVAYCHLKAYELERERTGRSPALAALN